MYENFLDWGYSYSFLIIVGILEAVGGVLLFVPRFRNVGIGILIIVMLGACYTHLVNYDELGFPFFSISLIAGLLLIFLLNQKSIKS